MPPAWTIDRYLPMGIAIARSLTRSTVAAEDVVQEAALALHKAFVQDPQRFESAEHARNYFLRAVRNLALKSGRVAEREQPLELEPCARVDEAEVLMLRGRQAALARILPELDPASRDLIARRFLEQQTLARIAADTGVPISTLHDREKALLAELRRRLGEGDPGETDREEAE